MGLRINTNVAAINAARHLRHSTASLNTTLERLSTGLRINRAKDDAAGLAISESFRTVIRGSRVAQRNVQDGISLLQTTEGALEETTNMLQRMRELAVQAANGTNSSENRVALQNEVDQLIFQINDIAWDTEFNQIHPLKGVGNATIGPASSDPIILQTGLRANQNITLNIGGISGGMAAYDLGINDVATAGTSLWEDDGSGNPTSYTSTGAASITTRAGAESALSVIDAAIQKVASLRAELGAQQNRLEFTLNNLAITEENSSASESALRDADMARETANFTRDQILVSAGTSVLAQTNVIPQTALQLLGK